MYSKKIIYDLLDSLTDRVYRSKSEKLYLIKKGFNREPDNHLMVEILLLEEPFDILNEQELPTAKKTIEEILSDERVSPIEFAKIILEKYLTRLKEIKPQN